jgi:hypothetical protein
MIKNDLFDNCHLLIFIQTINYLDRRTLNQFVGNPIRCKIIIPLLLKVISFVFALCPFLHIERV